MYRRLVDPNDLDPRDRPWVQCRIRGCTNEHPPLYFACLHHWMALRDDLKRDLETAFKGPGKLSREYELVANRAQAWLEGEEIPVMHDGWLEERRVVPVGRWKPWRAARERREERLGRKRKR